MKTFKVFLLVLVLSSCTGNNGRSLKLAKYPLIVSKKEIMIARNGAEFYFIDAFNEHGLQTFNVSKEDFNAISERDTLKNYTIY